MAYRDHDHHRHRSPRHHTAHLDDYSPSSSGHATPTTAPTSYLHSSLSGIMGGFGGLVRRISDMTAMQQSGPPQKNLGGGIGGGLFGNPHGWSYQNNGIHGVYTPPIHRSASPMAPPPLEPLELKGFREDTQQSARLLTSAVAEEIRIMVPERQRIEDEWNLVYSLDQDGASLATLYKMCCDHVGTRASFVLVIKDNEGGVSTSALPQEKYGKGK